MSGRAPADALAAPSTDGAVVPDGLPAEGESGPGEGAAQNPSLHSARHDPVHASVGPVDGAEPSARPAAGRARRGALIMTVAALQFSAMALFAKAASAHLSGPQVAWLRFALGLPLVVVPLMRGQRLRPVDYRSLFLRGLFGSFAVLTYFLAIAHLPVGIATLLNNSSPLFVALFSFLFLREPLGRNTLWALGVTSVGVALVALGGAQSAGAGRVSGGTVGWVLVGMVSAVMSGGAVTTIRSMRQREGSWEIFLSFCLVGFVLTGVPCALTWVRPTLTDVLWVVGMSGCSAIGQMAMTHALRDVRAITASLILQITPVATLILGALILSERLTPMGLLGVALTLAGVTWGTVAR